MPDRPPEYEEDDRTPEERETDKTLKDTFPASDPPSFSGSAATPKGDTRRPRPSDEEEE
jgi:hypothetical protein